MPAIDYKHRTRPFTPSAKLPGFRVACVPFGRPEWQTVDAVRAISFAMG